MLFSRDLRDGHVSRALRILVVISLALVAALIATLGALQIRVWLQTHAATPPSTPLSDEEKLDILASLSASSSASKEEKSKTLHSLSASTTSGPSDEEKLNILKSLRAKQ